MLTAIVRKTDGKADDVERNRFIAATREQALERLEIQSNLAVDAVQTVQSFPWIYTNAGCLAEAAAHWAFVAYPGLRDELDATAC